MSKELVMNWKNSAVVVMGVMLLIGVMVFTNYVPARGAEQGGVTGPRYTVVETQGNNLLVTDNGTNKLYYYTIDKDKEIGSDLKLRATIDLTQVGKSEINIQKAAK
jgi:hypothetical protein